MPPFPSSIPRTPCLSPEALRDSSKYHFPLSPGSLNPLSFRIASPCPTAITAKRARPSDQGEKCSVSSAPRNLIAIIVMSSDCSAPSQKALTSSATFSITSFTGRPAAEDKLDSSRSVGKERLVSVHSLRHAISVQKNLIIRLELHGLGLIRNAFDRAYYGTGLRWRETTFSRPRGTR